MISASISSPAHAAAPFAPTNISVSSASPAATTMDKAAISVSFTPSATDGSHPAPIAYIISATATGKVSGSTTIICNPCSNSKIDGVIENLAGGVTYDVVVTAKKDAFETSASSVPFLTQSIPDKPTVVSAVPGVKKVTLTWSAPTNTGGLAITGYKITASGISTTASDSATSKEIEGLSDGTTYSFKIVTVNSNGDSTSGDFSDAKTADVPDAPTNVTATLNGTTISNSWSAPTSNNGSAISEYKVYLINSSGTDVTAQTKTTTNTSIDMTNVASGTYTVKVTAKNGVGESARSTASSSVTVAGAALLENNPTIIPATIADIYVDQSINVSATSNFGTATFTVSGSPAGACTYSVGVVTAVSSGTCTITATTPGDATYATGTSSKTFTIIKEPQTINFPIIDNKLTTDTLVLSASSSSGLTVSFSATGVCTLSGLNVIFSGSGTCTITAAQAGTSKFATARTVTRSFNVTTSLFFGGGGGGSFFPVPVEEEKLVASIPLELKIVDAANPSKPLPGEVCVEVYDLSKKTATLATGLCSKSTGLIDLKVTEGKFRILVFAVGITNSSIEYNGEANKDKFTISGLSPLAGSSRYEIRLKAAPPAPKPSASPSPSPSAAKPSVTPTPTPSVTPKVSPISVSTVVNSVKITKNKYFQGVSVSKAAKSLTFSNKEVGYSIKKGVTFMAIAKSLPAKTSIIGKMVVPGGSTVMIVNTKLKKAGSLNLPVLKFTKDGTYTLRISYGKTSKTIKIKVSK